MRRNKILTLLLPIQFLLVQYVSTHSYQVEKYYSNGIYLFISKFLRIIFGWIPFSFGDVLYVLLIIYVFFAIRKRVKNKSWSFTQLFFSIGAKVSILYFIFYLFWGLNYYRMPLQYNLGLVKQTYKLDDLTLLNEKLLVKITTLHYVLTSNDTLAVTTKLTTNELLLKGINAYTLLETKIPEFTYTNKVVKKSIFSLPLTYMGFSGYVNPFTNEAQVNYKIPAYTKTMVTTHEIAHQLGYAKESEANFIGFLASINSKDTLTNYTAYLVAFQYSLSELRQSDEIAFRDIYKRIPKGVKKNVEQSRKFWRAYQNPLEPLFKKLYDLFLKSNNQKNGIKSYSKMTDLLMSYEKQFGI